MFSQIVNPKTNKKVSINSKAGKEILNNYINIQSGGSVQWNGRTFTARGSQGTRERSEAEIRVLRALGVEYDGRRGNVENYSAFWRNPNMRYPQFGYWNRNRFIRTSLNEFIIHHNNPTDRLINNFINIIELRFLDSRQHAINDGETRVFHSHSDIIIGMLEAFWTLTEPRRNTRRWLNDIDFLDIDDRVASNGWDDISVGLITSVMNYQLPDPEEGEAHQTYEQYEEDDLVHRFQGMGI